MRNREKDLVAARLADGGAHEPPDVGGKTLVHEGDAPLQGGIIGEGAGKRKGVAPRSGPENQGINHCTRIKSDKNQIKSDQKLHTPLLASDLSELIRFDQKLSACRILPSKRTCTTSNRQCNQ
jgi:hypothetical protein